MNQPSFVFLLSMICCGHLSSQTPGPPTVSSCERSVKALLATPNRSAFDTISESGKTACWEIFESSNATLNALEHLVEQGNRWAAEYLSKHLKQLDGGNLEDALVALGQFADHDMERLLWFAKNGLLSKQQLSDALTMLPLSLSDNPKAQLSLLGKRKNSLLQITPKELTKQKGKALSAIDAFAAEIRSKNPGSKD